MRWKQGILVLPLVERHNEMHNARQLSAGQEGQEIANVTFSIRYLCLFDLAALPVVPPNVHPFVSFIVSPRDCPGTCLQTWTLKIHKCVRA